MAKVSPFIEKLKPYVPGKSIEELRRETGQQEIIKLASNENPIGPSPKAVEAIQKALQEIHRYPDDGFCLKEQIAKRFQIKPENVILGNGSDSLMLAIVRAFVTEGGEVLTSECSFAQYTLMPLSRGACVKYAPMKNWRYDLSAIADGITPKTEVIFLANPNNPTGTIFTKKEWEVFYARVPFEVLIVCDEAYAEFVFDHPDWPDSMQYRYDNVITLRTFSKAYGLAGIRLGYGMAHGSWLKELYKVKLPFEPSVVALAAGTAALTDEVFLREYVSLVKTGRSYYEGRLKKIGVPFAPSVANFVMVDFGTAQTASLVNRFLLKNGIIIRPLDACGLPNAARITVGLPDENKKCMDGIEEALCGKS